MGHVPSQLWPAASTCPDCNYLLTCSYDLFMCNKIAPSLQIAKHTLGMYGSNWQPLNPQRFPVNSLQRRAVYTCEIQLQWTVLNSNRRSEMEGLFEREMDPLQTCRCDIVSFTGQNPERAKSVASAQVCSG